MAAPEKKELKAEVRINKFLASRYMIARRKADGMILAGKVFVNGRKAVLGDKIKPQDKVELKEKVNNTFSYYAYYKPRGLITNKQTKDEKDIAGSVNIKGVYPIGRLDKDSEGLILLSNDPRITDKLLNPKYDHEKEYIVKTDKLVKDHQLRVMERGMELEGDIATKSCKTKRLGEQAFAITLSEGKKHQIRRMCDAFGLGIESLKRTRVMNIHIGELKTGQYRKIEGEELKTLLKNLS